MSSASLSILEPSSSLTSRHVYRILVRDACGQPLPGVEVAVSLQGDGSFQSGFSAKEIKREMDAAGTAVFTWYRRGIVGRDVKATLTVNCERPDVEICLQPLTPEEIARLDGPRTGFVPPPPLKLPPRRV